MITLKFTILLSINLQHQDKPAKNKKGKLKKKKTGSTKKTSSKASKRTGKSSISKKSKKIKEKPLPEPEEDYVILVEEPVACLHIEYELFPNRFKYSVDVLCWGPVAKVYTHNDCKCFKTVIKGNIAWIPVYIEHVLNSLETDVVVELLGHVINFDIKIGKTKLGKESQAQLDNCKKFYIYEKDVQVEDFVEVFTEDPNVKISEEQDSLIEEMKKLLISCANGPRANEIITWQRKINDAHKIEICDIIRKTTLGRESYCKEFTEPEKQAQKPEKKKAKKKKKGKKLKQESHDGISMKVPGEVLITDPVLATFKYKNETTKIVKSFVLLTSENLLTCKQKTELNPLIVKILKINNFPYEVLKRHDISTVYVNCKIPGVAEFQTPAKQVCNETITFNESRLFINNKDSSKLKIMELLQFRKVIVELLGIKGVPTSDELLKVKKTTTKKKKKSSKGSKSKKSVKSKNEQSHQVSDILLCVACFDVSSLIHNFWALKEMGQCHNPKARIHQKTWQITIDSKKGHLSLTDFNLLTDPNRDNQSPLTEDLLIMKATTLKFASHFLVSQYPLFDIPQGTEFYKRLLLIVSDINVAKSLINDILLHNQPMAGPGLLAGNKGRRPLDKSLHHNQLLTGFLIDDCDNFIIFVEGVSNGYILSIINKIGNSNFHTVRVYYESSYVFEERIFEWLTQFSRAFYMITLKMPLREIFANQDVYIEGNIPVPCWKAIQKLQLIVMSTTFKSILSNELIPSILELFSFDMEYGVPLLHMTKEVVNKAKAYSAFNIPGSRLFNTGQSDDGLNLTYL